METTIKQAEEEKAKAYENAKRLYDEVRPLKEEVDMLRLRAGLDLSHREIEVEPEKLRPE